MTLLPKPDYQGFNALIMVDFGGADVVMQTDHGSHNLPAGTAHFLEHQLFHKKENDITAEFARAQGESNAFTTPTKTAYYVSAPRQYAQKNLSLLGKLIFQPYFSAPLVDNEKQIITQEIKMYYDYPDWQVTNYMMQKLFKQHPLAQDVAGTMSTIEQLTAAELYALYQGIYHPSNMNLVVTGDFKEEQLRQYLTQSPDWTTLPTVSPWTTLLPSSTTMSQVQQTCPPLDQQSRYSLGLWWHNELNLTTKIYWQTIIELAFQLVIGETTARYYEWEQQGLIDNTYGYSLDQERTETYAIFSGHSDQPAKTVAALTALMERLPELLRSVTPAEFARVQRQIVGNMYFDQDDLMNLTNDTAELFFYGVTPFDLSTFQSQLTLHDVQLWVDRYWQQRSQVSLIFSEVSS